MSTRRKLKHLYARVPDVHCKGLCAQACGVIPLLPTERHNISLAIGRDPGEFMADETMTCPLLKDNRCTIYADRPLICRLYGAVDHPRMRCPHGCTPPLTNDEGAVLLGELIQLG